MKPITTDSDSGNVLWSRIGVRINGRIEDSVLVRIGIHIWARIEDSVLVRIRTCIWGRIWEQL
jgi:hypothetical protein